MSELDWEARVRPLSSSSAEICLDLSAVTGANKCHPFLKIDCVALLFLVFFFLFPSAVYCLVSFFFFKFCLLSL